jgi:cell division protein FtsQ
MEKKRKISVRRILQLLVTVIVTVGAVVAISGASKIQDSKKLAGIDIRIKNSKYGFIDKAEIKSMLLGNRHIDLNKTNFEKLDVRQMEGIIDANPWVDDAQVYVDNKHVLHIHVTQRVPVARLFEKNGNSYYLDHTFRSMPLSDRYIHYTTVVTNVPVMKDDSAATVLKAKIVKLVKHVEQDSFWNAQVSQIIVADDETFEIVPIMGEHRILLGDTTNMKQKFDHLFAFYTKVLNRIGWNKYEVLDLRFDGQLVASPALPWRKPADNMTDINWVNTIINADGKAAESDTPAAMMPATVNAVVAATNAKAEAAQKAAVVTTQPVQQVPAAVQKAAVVKQETKPAVVKPAVVKMEAKPAVQPKRTVAKAVEKPAPQKKEPIKPAAKVVTKVTKPLPVKVVKKEEPKAAVKKANVITQKNIVNKEVPKKETKKEEKKEPAPAKYLYQGNENSNNQ